MDTVNKNLFLQPSDTEVASLIQNAGFDVKAEDMYDYDGGFRYLIGDFLYVLERGHFDECKKKACASKYDGYPSGSIFDCGCDADGSPILAVSSLTVHTKIDIGDFQF